MSKVLTKSIIAILAVGILVGAATTATIISAGLKPFNLALAQLRVPFLAQPRVQAPLQQQPFLAQPGVQAPLQQQPLTTTTSSSSGSFGPNCMGCITTQNLANGAVTTPKIAAGAVSITTQRVDSSNVNIPAGHLNDEAFAFCPSGSVATGGGYTISSNLVVTNDTATIPPTGWLVVAANPSSQAGVLSANVVCTTVHP